MKERSKGLRVFVIILVVTIMTMITSCGKVKDKISDKISEKVSEKVTEEVLGGKVDIDKNGMTIEGEDGSFQTGENLDWPKDIMGKLPKLKGNIISIWKDESNCSIMIQDVDEGDVREYIEELKDLDFKDVLAIDDDNMFMYSGAKEEQEETISVTYSGSDSLVTIAYSKE
ncbi:MAG: hypothetical protein CVV02_17905 [Firmicutes bacterium HGW-Firmicutes-7]|nr:MAG: hypothetical protein CVV02_17905 [Firmicutes bacterium HGW-Firmicutes-7]